MQETQLWLQPTPDADMSYKNYIISMNFITIEFSNLAEERTCKIQRRNSLKKMNKMQNTFDIKGYSVPSQNLLAHWNYSSRVI